MSTIKRLWWFVRRLSGDDAYEEYLRSHACDSHPPLTRREFYLREQESKWSRIQRCC